MIASSPITVAHFVRLLPRMKENEAIVLSEEGDDCCIVSRENLSPQIISASFQRLKGCVGNDRFMRLAGRVEIPADENPRLISKSMMKKVLLAMLDIQKTDVDELNGSIRDRFNQLIVFPSMQEFEAVLLQNEPEAAKWTDIEGVNTCGKGLIGLAQRVFLTLSLHYKIEGALEKRDKRAAALKEVEVLTTGLADREFQPGTVLHLRQGFFYVDQVFIGGGAYVAILRDFEREDRCKIVCRGTAARPEASQGKESQVNNLLREIGAMGVQTIWPALSQYLKKNSIQTASILGKSLGGGQAQQLAVLIEGILNIKIDKVTSCCSVGNGSDEINQIFAQEILEKRTPANPFKIWVVRNGGSVPNLDYVITLGGDHLGKGLLGPKCKVRVTYVQSGTDPHEIYPDRPPNSLILMNRLRTSLSGSHCYQMTLRQFTWIEVTDEKQIDYHLGVGMHLESHRRLIAGVASYFISFKGDPFRLFFEKSRNAILS